MFDGKSFVEVVTERFGNQNAQWCTGGLSRGQIVRALIGDDPRYARFVDAVAMGRRKNGKHLVRIQSENRKWILAIDAKNILVRW